MPNGLENYNFENVIFVLIVVIKNEKKKLTLKPQKKKLRIEISFNGQKKIQFFMELYSKMQRKRESHVHM